MIRVELRGSECRSREVERVPGASMQKPGERDAESTREPVRAHAKAAKSCAVPERANVGDVKALEVDAVPPEANAGRVGVTLG